MLPSLQDLPGLLPGIFHRGGAADETAGRGQFRQAGLDETGRSHQGRDRLSLSPQAQAIEEEGGAAGDAAAAETGSQSVLGQAGGMIRKALEVMRHDLAKALKGLGFDSDAVQNFTKAFVEPVLSALKDGVNFTAELSFATFSQVTATSAEGISQATSLVAQSLEIAVNHDTGEVSVSLAKLSFDQRIEARNGDGAAPLLVIDPDDLASPQELAEKILQGGTDAVGPAREEAPADENGVPLPEDEAVTGPSDALKQTLAELREQLAEEATDLQTRLIIYSVSTHKNDKGETVTKLLLDAQLQLSGLAEDAPAQEEAESLDVKA